MTTLSWNQPQCERCWITHNAVFVPLYIDGADVMTQLDQIRLPVYLREDDPIERCAWCGDLTIVGIYVRADPSLLPFPAAEDDVAVIELAPEVVNDDS